MKKLLILSLISLFVCNTQVFSSENIEEFVDSAIEYKYPELEFSIFEEFDEFEKQMINKYAELLKRKIEKDNRTENKLDKSVFNTKEYKEAVGEKVRKIFCNRTIDYDLAQEYVDSVENRNAF